MRAARVMVTRAAPGGVATMARLSARGFHPLFAPLSIVRRRMPSSGAFDGAQGVILTSANAVFALAAAPTRPAVLYAVGPATARVARARGFGDPIVGPGDASGLAATIAQRADPSAGPLVYLRAAEIAVDLAALLRERGVELREEVVYFVEPADHAPARFGDLADGNVDAVLFHAARAASTFAALASRDERVIAGCAEAVAIGLSARALAPLAALPFADRLVAERPDEDALFAALGRAHLSGVHGDA